MWRKDIFRMKRREIPRTAEITYKREMGELEGRLFGVILVA